MEQQTGHNVSAAAARVMARCNELAECSEEADRLTRTFCCAPMADAHRRLKRWMEDAGMACRVDAVGNLIGRWGTSSEQPTFMIGSHLDTVVDAGRYDGPLGVLLGLSAVELLRHTETSLPFAIEVVGFSEEEGVRFRTPFLGSRAIAGQFSESLLEVPDAHGTTVRSALEVFGVDANEWPAAEYPAESLVGFLEAHIEQGPVLEAGQLPVGVVTAIAGQTRSTFEFVGCAGHAGTVPHELRRDALAGAAEFIAAVEQIGQSTEGLFATVGDLRAFPNISNVIAGKAQVRLDLRHEDDSTREVAYARIQDRADEIAARRELTSSVIAEEQQPAVDMDARLSDALRASVCAAGSDDFSLVSGAGHDAVMMARKTATAMLFLRCRGGISHNPAESVDVDDVAVALDVMTRCVLNMAQHEINTASGT